jgi:hypothetical protein
MNICASGIFKPDKKNHFLAHAEVWSNWDSKPIIARILSAYFNIFILQRSFFGNYCIPFNVFILMRLATA